VMLLPPSKAAPAATRPDHGRRTLSQSGPAPAPLTLPPILRRAGAPRTTRAVSGGRRSTAYCKGVAHPALKFHAGEHR